MKTVESHLAIMIRNRVAQFGNKVALREAAIKGVNNPKSYTWKEFGDHIDQVASALVRLGVKEGDRVGIFSQNMPLWTIADFGIFSVRGISVPIYATHTTGHADYIINDSEIKVIFVGEQDQFDKLLPVISQRTYLQTVVFDENINTYDCEGVMKYSDFIKIGNEESNSEVKRRIERAKSEDLATLIYTSGTTGDPKGVMLDHDNFMFAMDIHDKKLKIDENDVSLAFLPLSHVFERAWTYYVLHRGVENNYLRNPKEVVDALQKVKPTLMCTVPRLLEKIHEGIQNKISNAPKIQQNLFKWALRVGRKAMEKRRNNKPYGFPLNLKYGLADKLIYNRLKNIFGGRIKFMPCAGSPLLQNINEFFHCIGMNIKYGYGLTETTATVSAFDDTGFIFGSIGTTMPDIEVKIGPESEIYVKGRSVMKGYYKKPQETAEVFEGEWLKTGDAGELDEQGNLFFRERIKELMKTSVGKYISPQMVEAIISSDQFVDQIAVFGDNRKFVSALVVPSFEFLEDYAKSKGINFKDKEELINHSSVIQFFKEKIEQLQTHLPNYEKVRKFKLLSQNFSMDKNELTPTLKLKRKVIEKKYKDLIDKMYN